MDGVYMTRGVAVWVLALALLMLTARPAWAQPRHQAGLVVVHGDGEAITRCVGFDEDSITGEELLGRAGFTRRMDVTAMGASVCRLDGEGCDAGESCFCQCLSSPCIYWSYWQRDGDQWVYATMGAGQSKVVDGALEGWVWGQGIVGRSAELQPPSLAFGDVCTGDNWVTGEIDSGSGSVDLRVWLWAALVAVVPLGVGGWLVWRRRNV